MPYVIVGAIVVILACVILAPQIVRGLRGADPFRPLTYTPRACCGTDPAGGHRGTCKAPSPGGRWLLTHDSREDDTDARTIRRTREGRR